MVSTSELIAQSAFASRTLSRASAPHNQQSFIHSPVWRKVSGEGAYIIFKVNCTFLHPDVLSISSFAFFGSGKASSLLMDYLPFSYISHSFCDMI